ncbi:Ig-like domain-containing protein [Nocardioides sp. LHD-245]|uniref:Ig-like domain-containing protein n=1 Tax=Nocardioides sp. LHD-245 TaxID=3051387 RepID=UPI0027E1A7EC|nr:Ig-like domain-containing protein [Nocardioides sp. LHD-245]
MSPAHADPAYGYLDVNVVDQYGRPVIGILETHDANGVEFFDGPDEQHAATATHSYSLPTGGYAFRSIAPWSGLDCRGVLPCTLQPSERTYDPVVEIETGVTTTYTLHVEVPAIVGGTSNGSTLSMHPSPGYAALMAMFATQPFTGVPAYQWQRDGVAIPGATAASYTTGPADGGASLSLRMMPSLGQQGMLLNAGAQAPPLVTNAIAVQKVVPASTTTKVKVPKRFSARDRVSVKVNVKSPGGVPDGFVKLKIGKLKVEKALRAGAVLLTLPRLGSGTYKVKVTYLGSTYFIASKAKAVKVTVRR